MKNYNEIKIKLNNSEKVVWISNKLNVWSKTTFLHNHSGAEIHVIGSDNKYVIEGKIYEVSKGDIIAIPAGIYHMPLECKPDGKSCAFQIDMPLESFSFKHFPPEFVDMIFSSLGEGVESGNYLKFSIYISLVCADFFEVEPLLPCITNDYSMIIHEFFSKNYGADIKLSDLAVSLHLSEKQAERLVKKCTGMTFKAALSEKRIEMANYLRKTTDLSLGEIAEKVGYRSYSGFWKAINKS